jgi:hypothetical protein
MPTNGRRTAQPFSRSPERRMGTSSGSSQKRRLRAHGWRHLSKAWDIRTSAHTDYSVISQVLAGQFRQARRLGLDTGTRLVFRKAVSL